MRKLSKLNEGAIGDIIKRASSDAHRIEDNIDLISPEDFAEYIKSKYISEEGTIFYYAGEKESILHVPISCSMKDNFVSHFFELELHYEKNEFKYIEACGIKSATSNEIIKVLKKFGFPMIPYKQGIYSHLYDVGESPRSKYIEMLNSTIGLKQSILKQNKKVNEGVIGDIIKRASSNEKRIEDDIENLDNVGLYDYINSNYEFIDSYHPDIFIHNDCNSMSIPILKSCIDSYFRVYVAFKDGKIHRISTCCNFQKNFSTEYKALKDNGFEIHESNEMEITEELFTKEGKVSVAMVIEMIDILSSINHILRRKVNEGAVGDIIKRATSDEKRIEDDVDNMSPEKFAEYIKSKYETKYNPISYSDSFGFNYLYVPIGCCIVNNFPYYFRIVLAYKDDTFINISYAGRSKCISKSMEDMFLRKFNISFPHKTQLLGTINFDIKESPRKKFIEIIEGVINDTSNPIIKRK